MEYILFIHNNVDSPTNAELWEAFIADARSGGMFLGGSGRANRTLVGRKPVADITRDIGGFMRFESDDKNQLLELLQKHPVVVQGGSVELCEMPKS